MDTSDSDRERIRGAYPGGPRKRDESDGSDPGRPRPGLARAEDLEARIQDGAHRARRKRRRRRVLVGFVVALLVAGGLGFWMGFSSHRTPAEIAAEEERQSQEGFDFAAESDRLLQQLWLMEDLERARRP